MQQVKQPAVKAAKPVSKPYSPTRQTLMFFPLTKPKYPNATAFCDVFYRAGIKGDGGHWLMPPGYWHTGVDMNLRGTARDGDLNAGVFAIADGVVSFAGIGAGTSWGNLICIEHNALNIGSRYAHLNKIFVGRGEKVQAGQLIGTLGKGYQNKWVAHLHFDIYVLGKLPNPSWWCTRYGAKSEVTNIFLNPMTIFEKFHAVEPGQD